MNTTPWIDPLGMQNVYLTGTKVPVNWGRHPLNILYTCIIYIALGQAITVAIYLSAPTSPFLLGVDNPCEYGVAPMDFFLNYKGNSKPKQYTVLVSTVIKFILPV